MSSDCNILNPLKRDGTSQKQRLLEALHPTFISVDERSIMDLLIYAKKYAALLRFYDTVNQADDGGDWVFFIENDVTTIVALLDAFDLSNKKKAFDALINTLNAPITIADAQAQFLALFPPIFDMLGEVDRWYQQSTEGLRIHFELKKIIQSFLSDQTINLLSIIDRASEVGPEISFDTTSHLNQLSASIWTLAPVPSAVNLFPLNNSNALADILEAADKVRKIFLAVHDAILALQAKAEDYLTETLEKYPEHEPHMALFLSFLQLFKIAQDHQNTITRRHLNFYYKEVLQLQPLPAQPDEVHIIFQLAKNFQQNLVKEGTPLKAGKDDNKTNIFFETDTDILVNKANLAEDIGLKTIYIEKDDNDIIQQIHAATDADSEDGLGADLENEEGRWETFGNEKMPKAEVGFALASPAFLLGEGKRKISITFTFEENVNAVFNEKGFYTITRLEDDIPVEIAIDILSELKQNIFIYLSGEKEWIKTTLEEVNISGNDIEFILTIPAGGDPIVPYDDKVYEEGFVTTHPLIKFVFDGEGIETHNLGSVGLIDRAAIPTFDAQRSSYAVDSLTLYRNYIYKAVSNFTQNVNQSLNPASDVNWVRIEKSNPYKYFQFLSLQTLTINLDVSEVRNIVLENDVGTINPNKPFQPFGPIPKRGSSFYIGSPEIFQKALNGNTIGGYGLTLDIIWADLPETSFDNHYTDYLKIPKASDGSCVISDQGGGEGNEYFKVNVEKLEEGQWISTDPSGTANTESLFREKSAPPLSSKSIQITSIFDKSLPNLRNFDTLQTELPRGFIRLNLQTSFFHKLFAPSITGFVSGPQTGQTAPPNEPYTPTIESVVIKYKSNEVVDFGEIPFPTRNEQLFHIGPFGWSEFYPVDNNVDKSRAIVSKSLVPVFAVNNPDNEVPKVAEGSLLVGLSNVEAPQTISILFQLIEASGDPTKTAPEIFLSYLSYDQWIPFESKAIISENTNGLLTSGIIRLALPKDISKVHNILPKDTSWIKISVNKDTAAISKAIAVYPQAVKAIFDIQEGNDLSRLNQALAAETISKLKERQAAIKKVLQPFASFNGKVKEQLEAPEGVKAEDLLNKEYNEYYIRVSERLRHKQRGITIYDYERLVLQQFPEVYKVKCINHTRIANEDTGQTASEHAPGFVKLVVIPNLNNKNAFNPLEPSVSLNTLSEIKSFLTPLISDFVSLEVKNPFFETIAVDFQVKLHPEQEADFGFYQNLLNEGIIRFLSPWIYNESADLQLGGRLHRSAILNFIEEQDYVDFVTDFKMNHKTGSGTLQDVEEAIASTSSSVLVSAASHIIKQYDKDLICLTTTSS